MKKETLDKIDRGIVVILFILASFFIIRCSYKASEHENTFYHEYQQRQKDGKS